MLQLVESEENNSNLKKDIIEEIKEGLVDKDPDYELVEGVSDSSFEIKKGTPSTVDELLFGEVSDVRL